VCEHVHVCVSMCMCVSVGSGKREREPVRTFFPRKKRGKVSLCNFSISEKNESKSKLNFLKNVFACECLCANVYCQLFKTLNVFVLLILLQSKCLSLFRNSLFENKRI